jgi:hypothetical protein
MKKLFSNKLEMAKMFYNLIIAYVRKIRAFNFHEPVKEDLKQIADPLKIPVFLNELLDRIKENRNISIVKLEKLSRAFEFSIKRLYVKYENDEKLKTSEFFKSCLTDLE